jgi:hypothetical protein
VRVCAVEEHEQAVDELEQKLQEREDLDDLRLEHEALQRMNLAWRAVRLPSQLCLCLSP